MRQIAVIIGLAFLIAGCASRDREGGSTGYHGVSGPGGMGSPYGPMPYGDIPGAVGGSEGL